MALPGIHMLKGAVDSHVHCCPHINARTVNVFEAVRTASAAGLRGLGLMDVFANSSGLAALAMQELGDLGVDVFGGIILEPYVGGVSLRTVDVALDVGYGPGTGARFVSLPCHHTQMVARAEGRSPAYIEGCLSIPARGPVQGEIAAIMDRCAERDVVLNAGHITAEECIRVVEEAHRRGVERILCPAAYYKPDEVRDIVRVGAFVDFSFFVMSHATQVGQTMIDAEKHRSFPLVELESVAASIRAAGPEHVVLSSDSGSYVLPPPVEAFRELLIMISGVGFSEDDIRRMAGDNPARLFKVGGTAIN